MTALDRSNDPILPFPMGGHQFHWPGDDIDDALSILTVASRHFGN